MSNKKDDKTKYYRILAQYPDTSLKIEDVATKKQFVMPAHQIACDQDMLKKFDGTDGCIIGFIAGSCVKTIVKLSDVQKLPKDH